MAITEKQRLGNFMSGLARRNPGQAEFHQAVFDVAADIIPLMQKNPVYEEHKILERLTEPDQIVIFRVNWEDDHGNFRANRGYRVQHNNAIGPYKGGSRIRAEATGYGCVFMMENMHERKGAGLKDKIALVSGSGNMAQYTVEKIHQLGGKAVTMSDTSGFIFDPDGIDTEKLEFVKQLENVQRGRIHEYADKYGVEFHKGQRPWGVPCDLAFPCATQNEIGGDDAKILIQNGCIAVAEGANMPTMQSGVDVYHEAKVMYAPSKAANAGGVAVSGLEMTQNSMRMSWSR